VSTGYNPVEGNRRASRNGLVSDLPPEIIPQQTDSQLSHRCRPGAQVSTPIGHVRMVSVGVYMLENHTIHRRTGARVLVRVPGGYATLEEFLLDYLVARFSQ
jgi:hypothetical protein